MAMIYVQGRVVIHTLSMFQVKGLFCEGDFLRYKIIHEALPNPLRFWKVGSWQYAFRIIKIFVGVLSEFRLLKSIFLNLPTEMINKNLVGPRIIENNIIDG